MRCNECGTDNPEKNRFCNSCGKPLPQLQYQMSSTAAGPGTATAPAVPTGSWISPLILVLKIRFLAIACIAILLIVSSAAAADTTDKVRALCQQGETALYVGQYQQALDSFDQCLAGFPGATSLDQYRDVTEAGVWVNKGDAYIGLKQYGNAVTALDKATTLDPSYAEAFQLKDRALRALKRMPRRRV